MPESPRRPLFWLGLLFLYALHASAALRAERVLWADGAYYFEQILENREFALGDYSRATADVLMEVPLMTLLGFGVTNLVWLKLAFGLPSFLLTPLCLVLCYWMAGPDKRRLGFPLATIAAGMMNTELLVIHESRVALTLFWPILFSLLDPLRRTSTLVVGALLAIPFVASYESAILLGPLVAYVAFERWRTENSPGQKAGITICLVSSILATAVAFASVLHPTHPSNFALFRASWRVVVEGGGAGVHLSLIALFLALPWFEARRGLRLATVTAAIVCCGAGVYAAMSDPTHIAVESQYRARIFNVVLPPLAAALLLLGRRSRTGYHLGTSVLGVLFAAQVALQLQLTAQWSAVRQITREELACVRGLVPVDTALSARLQDAGVSAEWMRGWHHPTLSFLDRPGPVSAVLDVYNGYTSWQPFYARKLDQLPDLARYGVDDREYRGAMERLLRTGGPSWETVSPCPRTLE